MIATAPNEFLFAGMGLVVTFATPDPNAQAGFTIQRIKLYRYHA